MNATMTDHERTLLLLLAKLASDDHRLSWDTRHAIRKLIEDVEDAEQPGADPR